MNSTQNQQTEACPVCESAEIDRSVTDLDGVCTQCGYVVRDGDEMEPPDWLAPKGKTEQSTRQSWTDVCAVRNATEKQLVQALSVLEGIGDRLTLASDLRRQAADIYCEAFLTKTTDGRDTDCVVAACVRFASLEHRQPIPTRRLTEQPDVGAKQFRLSYAALCENLDRTPSMPEAADYIPFAAGQLTLDDEQRQASIRLLEDVSGEPSLVGKDPAGIAAAGLYLTRDELTQSEVAEASGVSTETVRQRVAQLRELASDV